MRDVAEIGLLAVGGSFLPLAVHAYGVSPEATWRIASAAYLVLGLIGLSVAIWRRRRLDPGEFRNEPLRNAVNGMLNLVGFGLLVFTLLIGGPGSGARYTTAVLLLLSIGGIQFLAAAFSTAPDPPAV